MGEYSDKAVHDTENNSVVHCPSVFVVAPRWGLPSQGAGQPFPAPAGGLGRLQLRFSEDCLISVSKTHLGLYPLVAFTA